MTLPPHPTAELCLDLPPSSLQMLRPYCLTLLKGPSSTGHAIPSSSLPAWEGGNSGEGKGSDPGVSPESFSWEEDLVVEVPHREGKSVSHPQLYYPVSFVQSLRLEIHDRKATV